MPAVCLGRRGLGYPPLMLRLLLAVLVHGAPELPIVDCNTFGLDTWPRVGTPLPQNGHVHLVGTVLWARGVETLGERQPVLVDGDVQIPLRVAEVQVGPYRWAHVELVPTQPLVVGHRYVLRSQPWKDPKSWDFELTNMRATSKKDRALAWTVTAPLEDAPKWIAPPSVMGLVHRRHRVGTALYAQVEVPADGELRFRTELRPVAGGPPHVALLAADRSGQIAVGTGNCSGALSLRPDAEYEVTISAVDLAGHVTPARGPPLRFTAPRGK